MTTTTKSEKECMKKIAEELARFENVGWVGKLNIRIPKSSDVDKKLDKYEELDNKLEELNQLVVDAVKCLFKTAIKEGGGDTSELEGMQVVFELNCRKPTPEELVDALFDKLKESADEKEEED